MGKPKTRAHRMALSEANRITPEQFWAKVQQGNPDECWEWQGNLQHNGYGRISQRRAHREAWSYANERPVPEGKRVLHHCDNPPCCNPAHLYLGTPADNARDRKDRVRGTRGEQVNTAKLTEAEVYEVRRLCDAGVSQIEVARRYGISQPMAGYIARRKAWAWLPERDDESRVHFSSSGN